MSVELGSMVYQKHIFNFPTNQERITISCAYDCRKLKNEIFDSSNNLLAKLIDVDNSNENQLFLQMIQKIFKQLYLT